MIKKHYIFLLFLLVLTICGFSQSTVNSGNKQVEFSATRVRYIKEKGAQMLIGNVMFKHEGTIMTCDSAYRFDNNTIEAYNHILIRKGDSLTITGDQLNYNGNKRLATIEGNVTCVEKDMALTTPVMTYDVKNSIASYHGGGTIVNKNNTLTSRNGYYYSASKTLAFKHNVKLNNPEYIMSGDTLMYNTTTKTAFFLGPTNIVSKENKLYCEYGWYNTETEKSHLNTRAVVYGKNNELRADSIYYDRKAGFGKAYSCVEIKDTTNKITIRGDLAEHYEKTNTSFVTGRTLMIRAFKTDSLLMSSDTLYTERKISNVPGQKDSIYVRAYYNIKIFKNDLRGVADSMTYTTYDSTLILYKNPIMWTDSTQLNAREIRVHTANNSLESFELLGNAFVIAQEDSLKFNQIKGKEIIGKFYKDTISRIIVNGNAQIAYYIKNDQKKFVALNKTDCSNIKVYFESGQMNRITFVNQPVARLIPIKDVNPETERFKGFSWNPHKKPKNKEELMDF